MNPITFIYTNSLDMTADLLISKIGTGEIFRFNVDLWREYKIKIDHAGLSIENSAGRKITGNDIFKFYWRKPFMSQYLYPQKKIPSELIYMEEELTYAMRDMVNLAWSEEKIVLVEPLADSRVGKFVQLKVGAKYFKIPPYKFVSGSPDFFEPGKSSIVKSLTSKRVSKDSVLYTTRVEEDQLEPSTPWMIRTTSPLPGMSRSSLSETGCTGSSLIGTVSWTRPWTGARPEGRKPPMPGAVISFPSPWRIQLAASWAILVFITDGWTCCIPAKSIIFWK
jgi:hypothetical protein